VLALSLTGCVPNSAGDKSIAVTSSNTECVVARATAAAGSVNFTVKNSGDKVTDFYILASDGLRVVGEVENIGPGITRPLTILAEPGTYYTVCKPGMVGAGIGNATFIVTQSSKGTVLPKDIQNAVDAAGKNYATYVNNEAQELLADTQAFAAAYSARNDDEARRLYPETRVHWERIETVAESFGDLDPKLDAREADLEAGAAWTGWHAIEKDLWPAKAESGFKGYSTEKRNSLASQLVTDTQDLAKRIPALTFTLTDLTNGAIGLLDEVAMGKVTGEEEIWSETDLWDFQANVDGARVLYDGVRPILVAKKSALPSALTSEFSDLQKLLDSHRRGSGFVKYSQLSAAQVRALSDQVNALAEKLNTLTSEVLK
jgi:iron uptake system component EfeO